MHVVIRESGSNFLLFEPGDDAGIQWLLNHTDGLWWGNSLAVEHRYAQPLAEALQEAGFQVTPEE